MLVRPFIWQDQVPSQRVGLQVNGIECGSAVVAREPAVLDCQLPWSLFAVLDEVDLVWSFPDAVRPSEVKGIEDDRLLAFRFERMELTPAALPDRDPARFEVASDNAVAVAEPEPAMRLEQIPVPEFSAAGASAAREPEAQNNNLEPSGPLSAHAVADAR